MLWGIVAGAGPASKNPMSHTNLVVGGEGLSAWSRAAKGYEIYCI
jgi:hypothetical protein